MTSPRLGDAAAASRSAAVGTGESGPGAAAAAAGRVLRGARETPQGAGKTWKKP